MEKKSREEVMAERKLRKAAKQSKKQGSINKQNAESSKEKASNSNDFHSKMENLKVSHTKSCENSTSSNEVSLGTKKVAKFNENSVLKKNIGKNSGEDISNLNVKSGDSINVLPEEIMKTKAQSKAERRAKQEAQRAAKAQKKSNEELVKSESATKSKVENVCMVKGSKKNKLIEINDPNKVKLVSHLYFNSNLRDVDILTTCRSGIHKSVMKLGQQYRKKVIIGSNARVVAFLNTLKQVLNDYTCEHNFSREFEVVLESTVQYLKMYRPLSVSMTNAVKHLKWYLTQLPNTIPSQEAQIKLREVIDEYVKEQIDTAGKAIVIMVQKKISQNDVILTFGYSSLIERILTESFQIGIQFRVVIVDAGPLYEGKELLRRLVKNGLHCTYVLLSAASYIMKEATKVLLGAHALLTNGYVMSRAGSSQIALIARSFNVPVLVCCETHKFSERVQTDALVHNELGDPLQLLKGEQSKSNKYMKSLTLMYDVTPSDHVTAVVTELAILPCTSVPVVLRVKPTNPLLI